MSSTDHPTDHPTEHPADDALERRVAQALRARAALKTVEPAALGERLARVHAAADQGPGERGPAVPAPVVELVGTDDDDARPQRHRSRLLLAVVASAAAAAVIVAAALAAVDRGSSEPAPATTAQPSPSSSSYPGEEWSGFSALAHAQWPADLEGVGAFGGDVVAGSVRMLVQLGQVKYWAAWTADGRVCWKVVGPGTDAGGCELETGPPELTEVSDGSAAPEVWLVPAGTPTGRTDPLTAKGLVEWVPGVWAEASALTPPVDRYAPFRAAPTAADEVPPSSAVVVREPIVPGSLRQLYDGEEGTFYAAYLPLGKLCLYFNAPEGGMSASTCQTPEQLAGEGFSGLTTKADTNATAWLVPDDLDTSGWQEQGRVRLSGNLWFKSEVLPPYTPEPVRSMTPEEEQAVQEALAEAQAQASRPRTVGPIAPEVVGLSVAEATQLLESYGLPVDEVVEVEAGSAPSGMVLKATPGTYVQVPEGTTAQLVVAK